VSRHFNTSVMLRDVCAYRSVTKCLVILVTWCTLENMHTHNVCEKPSKHFFNHKVNLRVHTAEFSQFCNMSQRLSPAQFSGLL
jgi:hypothetical protein